MLSLIVTVSLTGFTNFALSAESQDNMTFILRSSSATENGLAINELMASNTKTIKDQQGQYDDWIEIYNFGDNVIDIAGMYLTDDLSIPTKWRIPNNNPSVTTISPNGYLLIWADEDVTDSGLHADFKLNADGEELGLFDADGRTLIDSITFYQQTSDISYGRYPDANDALRFFGTPTPGAANNSGYLGAVAEPEFSHSRGFYDAPFSVTIGTETQGAIVYYTLDGKEPNEIDGRLPAEMIYTEPVPVTKTTCLRAMARMPGWKSSKIETRTYIFISDVVLQSPSGQRPSSSWPSSSVNGQVIDYGMDPDVVNDARYSNLIEDALLAIPTISLVTSLKNLFDPGTGIYVHAGNEGTSWERPVSVELLNPDGSNGFQINAGLRIRGGYSRQNANPKHAFRLFFRPEYGQAKLKYPLFEEEGADEFENLDLRCSQNYSWSFDGSSKNTEVREVFSRDLQGEMRHPYTRSRYYHLYINGQYWGLYQSQERSEASYAESYMGGSKDDYDTVKSDTRRGYSMIATDGSMDAYRRLYDATMAGFRTNAAYYKAQGKNPDGTPNPAYERLLDVDNLIDFMIIEYYTADRDGPGSRFVNRPNNVFGIYNRLQPDGWKWFQHDSEHSLGAYDHSLTSSNQNLVTPFTVSGSQWQYFNPQWLHEQLISSNADYRMHFADHVYRYFFNDGLLTPGKSQARVQTRAEQINLAIIAESARWGDAKRHPPFTKDSAWLPEINWIVNTYLPTRTEIVLNQFKSVGWYPNIEPPTFSPRGGSVPSGFNLQMQAAQGTIYYTIDESDPRLPGGSLGIISSSTLVPETAAKKVLVPNSDIGSSWISNPRFSDSSWLSGSGGVGYERGTGYEALIKIDVGAQMYDKFASCYIRIPFTLNSNPSGFDFLILNMRYDDGFVAYINGVEVQRALFTGTPAWNSAADGNHEASGVESFDISDHIGALRQGINVLAIHGLNVSTTSSDLLISDELVAGQGSLPTSSGISPAAVRYTGSVTLNKSTHVKSRVLDGSTWSTLNEVTFAVGPVAQNLRVTEIMYHPYSPDDVNEPNVEYIELTNIGTQTINLNLVRFTNGVDFTFPDVELALGEYIIVVENHNASEARYGPDINIVGQYIGKLNNNGERIRLEDAVGQTILDFDYKDGWLDITDGGGYSLTIIDAANPDPNSWSQKESWRASLPSPGM